MSGGVGGEGLWRGRGGNQGGWGERSRFKAMRTGDEALCLVTERETAMQRVRLSLVLPPAPRQACPEMHQSSVVLTLVGLCLSRNVGSTTETVVRHSLVSPPCRGPSWVASAGVLPRRFFADDGRPCQGHSLLSRENVL